MASYTFERESRTPQSEAYLIGGDGDEPVGRVDLHYTPSGVVQATLCVPEGMSEDDLQALISDLDERIVMSAEPFRDDFVVTVWRGKLGGVYSEESIDALEDADSNGHNGHH